MPQAPGFAVFQRVTADLLNATTPTIAVKATSLPSVVSSTTLINDGELINIALGIGVWDVQAYFYCTGDPAATTAGQINIAWTFSGTASGLRSCTGPAQDQTTGTAGNNFAMRFDAHPFAVAIAYGIKGSTPNLVHERSALTVTAAGNLGIQYAQRVSSATGTAITAGSYLTYRQIG